MNQASSVQLCHPHPAPKRRRFAISSLALTALLLVSKPNHLAACSFHTSLSGNTLSKQIADSVEVVAMRPSAQNPFEFETVEQLKGISSDSTPSHLVDSTTRRRLAQSSDHAVLFARGVDGQWTRLMYLDENRRRIAEEVLVKSTRWATLSGTGDKRDYFAALLSHPNTEIRHTALRELDAISYEVLRNGTYPVTGQDLLSGINDMRSMAYAPIKILLLGIVGDRDADTAIAQQLARLAASGSTVNLGAWITAAIENGGREAVGELERKFLGSDNTLSRQQLIEIVRALSVQSASNRLELGMALDSAVIRLVGRYPEAAPMVAQAFGTASDWSQVNLVRELIAEDIFTTPSDLMAAASYLSRAQERNSSRRHPLLRSDLPLAAPNSRP